MKATLAKTKAKAFLYNIFMVKENKNPIFNWIRAARRSENDYNSKQEIVSITYEEIGFFPRSFSRVLDRFLKQVFSDVENLVIQEYRFYRYLFLTTLKCLLILFFVPFLVNFFSKNYLVRPLTEYFWNTQQNEIFLNSYQQKRAFAELKDFEEKIYFESLINLKDRRPSTPLVDIVLNASFDRRPKYASVSLPEHNKKEGATHKRSCFFFSSYASSRPSVEAAKQQRCFVLASLVPKVKEKKKNSYKLIKQSFYNSNGQAILAGTYDIKKYVSFDLPSFASLLPSMRSSEAKEGKSKEGNTASLQRKKEGKQNNNVVLYKKEANKHAGLHIEQRLQEKTIELAFRYNNQSIEAITNFFADLISFITLCYLLFALEIQINITKSFLLEVFFGLDDSKKSLLILLITDLLVGYHSSNLWELFFEFLFTHYGLPESQTGIFLLVATLPVLLDVLFKYLIFRHLNRSSPATVATYHAMIE